MTDRTPSTVGAPATDQQLRDVLLEVADALETGDLDGLVHWCVDSCRSLLGATATAIVTLDRASPHEQWRVTASDESVGELIELDLDLPAGACRDFLGRGEPMTIRDLSSPSELWAEFAAAARTLRLAWVHAEPVRLQEAVIGALYLFGDTELAEDLDVELGRALAQLALATGEQQHALDVQSTEVAQLHTALDTRLVIEQAKGILASRHDIDVEQAFLRLRKYARDHRMNIHDVASALVENHVPDLR